MPNNILPNKLVGYPKKIFIKPPNKLLRTDCHCVNGNFGFAKDLITYCPIWTKTDHAVFNLKTKNVD